MANAHVTRVRGARSSRTRPTPEKSSTPRPRRPRRASPKPKANALAQPPDQLRTQLELVARHLEVLHATSVTLELALTGQNAERDEDIARCLMRNLTEPLNDQAEALQAIASGLEQRSVPDRAVGS